MLQVSSGPSDIFQEVTLTVYQQLWSRVTNSRDYPHNYELCVSHLVRVPTSHIPHCVGTGFTISLSSPTHHYWLGRKQLQKKKPYCFFQRRSEKCTKPSIETSKELSHHDLYHPNQPLPQLLHRKHTLNPMAQLYFSLSEALLRLCRRVALPKLEEVNQAVSYRQIVLVILNRSLYQTLASGQPLDFFPPGFQIPYQVVGLLMYIISFSIFGP